MTVGVIITGAGSIPLANTAPVSWAFTTGARPSEQEFDIRPSEVAALKVAAAAKAPVILRYAAIKQGTTSPANTNIVNVTNLWIKSIRASSNPRLAIVTLWDRRWFLSRAVVSRRYNHRREVGFRRIESNADDALVPVEPVVQFTQWSLKNTDGTPPGDKFTISEILDDVFERVKEKEKEYTGVDVPAIEIAPEVKAMDKKVAAEQITAKGSGDEALEEVMKAIPEAAMWVDDDGIFKVFSRASGEEITEIAKLGALHVGSGHIRLVSNEFISPAKMRIHFTRKAELRFNFNEEGDVAEDSRTLINVLPNPDFALKIGEVTVPQTAYIPLSQALVAFGAPPGIGGTQLTLKVIQTAFVPFLDLWAGLAQLGVRTPDIDWATRISVIQSTYRQLFSIDRKYWDRILSVEDKRVGIVNNTNGATGPAEVWADYCYIATTRSMFRNLQDQLGDPDSFISPALPGLVVVAPADVTMEYAINVKGFPANFDLDSFTKRAPADVTIVDPQQGIVGIRFLSDKNRVYEMALPGLIVNQNEEDLGPTGDLTDETRPVSFDCIIDDNQIPKLSAKWQMSMILTCVPAAPNNERQLEVVEVEPEDVKDLLPAGAKAGIEKAIGPIWDIYVEAGLPGAVALIRWRDDRAADIDAIFGLGNAEPNTEGLVLNKVEQSEIQENEAPSLNAIAGAIAAGVWSNLADRLQGQGTFDLNNKIEMKGWISQIVHTIAQDGRAETTVLTPEQIQRLSYKLLLDPSTRAILDREVVVKK